MAGLAELAAKADADLATAETAKGALGDARLLEQELVSQLSRAEITTRAKADESAAATNSAIASAAALSRALAARLEALRSVDASQDSEESAAA